MTTWLNHARRDPSHGGLVATDCPGRWVKKGGDVRCTHCDAVYPVTDEVLDAVGAEEFTTWEINKALAGGDS